MNAAAELLQRAEERLVQALACIAHGPRTQELMTAAGTAMELVDAAGGGEAFSLRPVGAVYESIRRRLGEDLPIDAVLVGRDLPDDVLEQVGGYLGELVDPRDDHTLGLMGYADSVVAGAEARREAAERRGIRGEVRRLLDALDVEEVPASTLRDQALARLQELGATNGRPPNTCVSLREVLERADYTERPRPAVPRVACYGRVSLIAAREKDGKSTWAAALLAAKSAGLRIVGEQVDAGPALMLSLEEHSDDMAAKLVQFGADPDRTWILTEATEDPFRKLEAAVVETSAELVIVDTLAALVERLELESGDASAWTPVMRRLTGVARRTNAALVLLHHSRKSDGKYRDSTAIGANVDLIVEMGREVDRPTVRTFKGRGRWPFDDFSAELRESPGDGLPAYFALTGQTLSIDAQVLAYLEQHPGAGKRKIRDAVTGRSKDVDSAVEGLLRAGAIKDGGGGVWPEFHVVRERVPAPDTLQPAESAQEG